MAVQNALAEGPFSMRELADACGISYGVLRAWSIGRRTPTPDNLRKLADAFRARGERLELIADQLTRAAATEE